MLPINIRMNIRTLLLAFVISVVCGQDRKINPALNPGCDECHDETLVYIQAVGASDTIHQIWDFTQGSPTVIFAIASVNSTLNITWDKAVPRRSDTKIVPKKFEFSEEPRYSFAASFYELYEYNDLDDSGYIDPHSPHKAFPLDRMRWMRNISLTDREAVVIATGNILGGTVQIKLDLLPFKDYATQLPHLIHTSNSTLFDISVANLTTSRHYNASRFALHFQLVGTDGADDTFRYNIRKSLDDEHTPGVFEIVEVRSPMSYTNGAGGFMQFRPVAYTQPKRGVATSTLVRMSNFDRSRLLPHTTVQSFYRDTAPSRLLVQDVYVSIGEPGDGYYRAHNYTAWSFSMGYGRPPMEGFSPLVLGIISAGLGVPIMLALSGVAYVVIRKRRNGPTRFRNDE